MPERPDALGPLLDAAYSALEAADRANALADDALDAVRGYMGAGDGGTFDEAMGASRFDRAEAIAMLAREDADSGSDVALWIERTRLAQLMRKGGEE